MTNVLNLTVQGHPRFLMRVRNSKTPEIRMVHKINGLSLCNTSFFVLVVHKILLHLKVDNIFKKIYLCQRFNLTGLLGSKRNPKRMRSGGASNYSTAIPSPGPQHGPTNCWQVRMEPQRGQIFAIF